MLIMLYRGASLWAPYLALREAIYMGLVEITGEVDQKERSQMTRPGVVKPEPKEFLHIPVFRLRCLPSSGKLFQVFYKEQTLG